MTIDDRFVIEPSDLKVARFECSTCGAAVSFKIPEWKGVPDQCPGCRVPWLNSPQEYETVNALRVRLMGIVALMARESPYKLRFEIDRPKS